MTKLDYAYQYGTYKALVEMFVTEVDNMISAGKGEVARQIYERKLALLADQAQETLKKYENNG